jgi:hypothetical protein
MHVNKKVYTPFVYRKRSYESGGKKKPSYENGGKKKRSPENGRQKKRSPENRPFTLLTSKAVTGDSTNNTSKAPA